MALYKYAYYYYYYYNDLKLESRNPQDKILSLIIIVYYARRGA